MEDEPEVEVEVEEEPEVEVEDEPEVEDVEELLVVVVPLVSSPLVALLEDEVEVLEAEK